MLILFSVLHHRTRKSSVIEQHTITHIFQIAYPKEIVVELATLDLVSAQLRSIGRSVHQCSLSTQCAIYMQARPFPIKYSSFDKSLGSEQSYLNDDSGWEKSIHTQFTRRDTLIPLSQPVYLHLVFRAAVYLEMSSKVQFCEISLLSLNPSLSSRKNRNILRTIQKSISYYDCKDPLPNVVFKLRQEDSTCRSIFTL